MSNKSYQQYCGLAQALDIIGQRWTLLIVRELLTGPKRFKALIDQLPGIGSNLLVSRLRDLEQQGLLLSQSASGESNHMQYTLTPQGETLRPVVQALLIWGTPRLTTEANNLLLSRSSLHLSLQMAFQANLYQPQSGCYTFIIDEEIIQIVIEAGRVQLQPDTSCMPDLTVRCTSEVLVGILSGTSTLKQTLKAGLLHYEGNTAELMHVFEQLGATPQ